MTRGRLPSTRTVNLQVTPLLSHHRLAAPVGCSLSNCADLSHAFTGGGEPRSKPCVYWQAYRRHDWIYDIERQSDNRCLGANSS